jgi:lipopolysaccharide transport system ATP-binding protein
MTGIAIKVENLSKCYHIYDRPQDRLKQSIVPRIYRTLGYPPANYFREFWALRDVSFEIKKGETVGIIGRNGSGKSTLLQMICGTLNPTSGGIQTNGRIAALLELGSGFNPEFTGRENVYMNSAIIGLSKEETDARFEDIVAFADIGEFIDQPGKTYSSGMLVRLAFAVAINVNPQILIIDEALSVGDELFQRKCFARIEAIKNKGATILFVSHSASIIVDLCDRAFLIDQGRLILCDTPRTTIKYYHRLIFTKKNNVQNVVPNTEIGKAELKNVSEGMVVENVEGLTQVSQLRYESHGGKIIDFGLYDEDGNKANLVTSGFTGCVKLSVEFDLSFKDVVFGFHLKSVSGIEVAGLSYPNSSDALVVVSPGDVIDVLWNVNILLTQGTYFFTFGVRSLSEGGFIDRIVDVMAIKIIKNTNSSAFGIFDISRGNDSFEKRINNE